MTKKEYIILLLLLLNLKTLIKKTVREDNPKMIKEFKLMQISMTVRIKKNKNMSTISIKFLFLKYKEQNLMKLDFTNYQVELFMTLLVTISMRTDMMRQEDTTIKTDNIWMARLTITNFKTNINNIVRMTPFFRSTKNNIMRCKKWIQTTLLKISLKWINLFNKLMIKLKRNRVYA